MLATLRRLRLGAYKREAAAKRRRASCERRLVSPGFNEHVRLDEAVSQEKVLLLLEQVQPLVRKVRMEWEVEIRSIRTGDPRLSCPGFALEDGGQLRRMRRRPVRRPQEDREEPRHQIRTSSSRR